MNEPLHERTIFHADLDAFFVAVERVLDPSLIGKPVIVGGLGSRGVVSTASYEARVFGVHSAQPMAIARRRCPQAVFVRGSYDSYREFSSRFFRILDEFSPVVSSMSIDEAYIDMTGTERSLGMPLEVAENIRRRVRDEIGIVVSIGIGPNRLVAKVATEDAKPDGVKIVRPQEVKDYFAPKPVRALPGIGPKAAEALSTLRIDTLGQLSEYPLGPLRRALGPNNALWLQMRSKGIDNSSVERRDRAKSISAETTFAEDLTELDAMLDVMRRLSERVGGRLRKGGMHAKSVSLKLRYSDFTTLTRQLTLSLPSDGDEAIYEASGDLLRKALNERGGAVRLLGVGVSGLGEPASQLSLLEEDTHKDSAISSAVDKIRDKFGEEAVKRGR